jgi:hypothetical protein
MATRRRIERETTKQGSARIYKSITPAYGFWALGLVIGAIGLTPSTVSASGLALTIAKPQLVQGIIFLVSLAYGIHALLSLQARVNPFLQREAIRIFIWGALPKGTRSFRGMTLQDLVEVRKKARLGMKAITGLTIFFASIPMLLIVIFYPLTLVRALGSVVGIV